MEKIRAKRDGQRYIYIHNDLSNAAHYFLQKIERKLEENNRDGIAFDCMACLVMLAFTFEAKINFLGDQFINGWVEREAFDRKVVKVFDHFGVARNDAARPYSSIVLLKKFRDTLAHGKPIKEKFEEIVEGKAEELDRRIDLSGEWEKDCNEQVCFMAHADVESIWKELLQKSNLSVYDTMTHGEGGLTFIERIVETNPPGE